MDLVFECIWNNGSPGEVEKVKDLWRKYRAIETEELIETRSRQIVFVVKDVLGDAVGVSTVRPVKAALLNNHMFYEFRCFIAPHARAPGLDSLLALKTKQFLEQEDSSGNFKGLIMIVENADLKKQRTKAVWPATGMVFAGYTSRGDHIRVGYFKGARI
jgi:hypothetical protein